MCSGYPKIARSKNDCLGIEKGNLTTWPSWSLSYSHSNVRRLVQLPGLNLASQIKHDVAFWYSFRAQRTKWASVTRGRMDHKDTMPSIGVKLTAHVNVIHPNHWSSLLGIGTLGRRAKYWRWFVFWRICPGMQVHKSCQLENGKRIRIPLTQVDRALLTE